MDVIHFADPYLIQRRLCPQMQIARHMYTLLGKVVTVLWILFLLFGPSYDRMRRACNSIGGFTSDLGTERNVPGYKDILIPFLRSLKVPIPRHAARQEFLFPVALLNAGWNHIWDGLIRWGLCSLHWFSHFLRCLKALVKVLRDDLDDIVDAFAGATLSGVRAILKNLKVPNFLEWRWGSIGDVTKELWEALVLLRQHFAVFNTFLCKLKDGTRARLVKHALTSFDFFVQFKFVKWFSKLMCDVMAWGGSCACHVAEFERGQAVDCPEKRRLLPWCFKFGSARLQEMLTEGDSWTVETWGHTPLFFRQVQGMVRLVFARGRQKMQPFDELPFILARIGVEPDIPYRCIAKYDARPKAMHDKVSIEFCDHESRLRPEILALKDDDLEVPKDGLLYFPLRRVKAGNLLDKLAEGPHSVFKKLGLHSRGSGFAWQAASMRLEKNLDDAEELPQTGGPNDLQYLWDHYKGVLKPRENDRKSLQCTRKEFLRKLYYCEHTFTVDDSSSEGDGDDDDVIILFWTRIG